MQLATGNCQQTSSTSSANTTFGGSDSVLARECTCQSAGEQPQEAQRQTRAEPHQQLLAAGAPAAVSVPHIRQDFNCVWSIDLAHLLRRCGATVALLTVTIGANPSYAGERFYAENLAEDEARVAGLFRDAPAAGIPVQQRSVAQDELQSLLLTGRYLVIALLDKNKLYLGGARPDGRAGVPLALRQLGLTQPPAPQPHPAAYTGHYVLLCGYDARSGCFLVRDPASVREQVCIPVEQLEAARRSWGTDEDLLLVTLQERGQLGSQSASKDGQQQQEEEEEEQQQQQWRGPVVYG